jgi:hypothetical protein
MTDRERRKLQRECRDIERKTQRWVFFALHRLGVEIESETSLKFFQLDGAGPVMRELFMKDWGLAEEHLATCDRVREQYERKQEQRRSATADQAGEGAEVKSLAAHRRRRHPADA